MKHILITMLLMSAVVPCSAYNEDETKLLEKTGVYSCTGNASYCRSRAYAAAKGLMNSAIDLEKENCEKNGGKFNAEQGKAYYWDNCPGTRPCLRWGEFCKIRTKVSCESPDNNDENPAYLEGEEDWQLKCSVQIKQDEHGWHTVAGASSGSNNACALAIKDCQNAHSGQKCSGMCKVPNSSRPYFCS